MDEQEAEDATPPPKPAQTLREKIEWRMTGGHPDQGEPDPIWREMYTYMLRQDQQKLAEMQAYRSYIAQQAKFEILRRLSDVPHDVAEDLKCLPLTPGGF